MSKTGVPGQAVLPALEADMGFASITNLKPAQEVLVWEFVLSGNAKLAYMRAYPDSGEASSIANASRLLKTERVQKRIAEVRQQLQNQYGLDAFSVMRLLAMSMSVDRRQFVNAETGKPLDLHQLPAEAAAIADVEIIIDRFGNKHAVPVVPTRIRAAEALAKIAGISQDQQRISTAGSGGNAQVNFYMPSNGRDPLIEQNREKFEELRGRFKEVLGD